MSSKVTGAFALGFGYLPAGRSCMIACYILLLTKRLGEPLWVIKMFQWYRQDLMYLMETACSRFSSIN
jgi:hypothetical protein